MTGIVTIACLAIALVTALVAGFRALRDEPVTRVELAAATGLEVVVLAYVVVRVVDLVEGHRPPSLVVAIGYLIGILLVTPIAAALAIAERSRWSPVVLGSGALVVCVVLARIDQVWTRHG